MTPYIHTDSVILEGDVVGMIRRIESLKGLEL